VAFLRAQAREALQQLRPQGGGRKRDLEPAGAGALAAAQAPPRQRMRLAAGARPAVPAAATLYCVLSSPCCAHDGTGMPHWRAVVLMSASALVMLCL